MEKELLAKLAAALAQAGAADADIAGLAFTVPPDPRYGDLTTNAALGYAKALGRPPRALAEEVAAALADVAGVDAVEVAGPGFVNLRLTDDVLFAAVVAAVEKGDAYGRGDAGAGAKVQVEFVSANPTGPLNAVSARAAAYGDALARLLAFSGYDVEREFYVCDVGTQMDLLGQSVAARLAEQLGKPAEFPDDGYRGEYIKDLARRLYDAAEIAPGDDDAQIAAAAASAIIAGQKQDLDDFGVSFDNWFYETSLYPDKVEETQQVIERRALSYVKDGARWLRTSAAGDDEDRVIVRADGRPTYFLADIAYHLDKHARGFTKVIDVLGPDHHGHVKKMLAAMRLLGIAEGWLEIIISQQVNLVEGGERVKMSKRAGALVTMREVVADIGVDAARFFLLMRTPSAHLDFDLELARKETPENPVYYAQYCYARVESVKAAAGEKAAAAPPAAADLGELRLAEERALARKIWAFPKTVAAAAARREPHRVAAYATELAALFHNYYQHHRILQAPSAPQAQARLVLTRAVGHTEKNALALLGVRAPARM